MRPRRRALAPAALVSLGLLVLQVAWLVTLPPFRGSDEFEHAYRAAGVATGQWVLTDSGASAEPVVVPASLAAAAAPQCAALPSQQHRECRGTPLPEGRARVVTRAGSYQPAFYAVVGYAGRLAAGDASLYAMRTAALLLCWLLVLAGLASLAAMRAGPAVWLGALAGLTPTFVYSTVVVAPNGVEMAAGFALWCALLALLRAPADGWTRRTSRLLVLAAASGVVLVTPRALGPLWALLIVGCVVAYAGPAAVLARLRQRPGWCLLATAPVVMAALASVQWSRASGLVAAGSRAVPDGADPTGRGVLGTFPVHVWAVQAVAAFPYRDQPGPPAVLACVALVLGALVVMALRRGRGRQRLGLLVAVAVGVGGPVLLVAATRGTGAAEWQGRYALPVLVGVPLLAGSVIQDVRWRSRFAAGPVAALALVLLGIAHTWSLVWLEHQELGRPASVGDAGWHSLPLVATGLVAALGWALVCGGVALVPRSDRTTRTTRTDRSPGSGSGSGSAPPAYHPLPPVAVGS